MCCNGKTAFHNRNITLTLKHGGGSEKIRRYFAALQSGQLALMDGTRRIHKESVCSSVHVLKLETVGLCSKTVI